MKSLSLIVCLILAVGYLTPVQAVTDAELEALEKQIEQQEAEEKKRAEATEKRKAEAEKKRLAELERQRQEEQRRLEEERGKLEGEKKKLEEARLAELERKRQEEEAKRLALEEQKRKEEEAARARVTVLIFRWSRFVASGESLTLKHNDTNIGTFTSGTFLIYTSPTGKHTFSTEINPSYPPYNIDKTFEFEPGQTYYIQFLVAYDANLVLVSQAEARKAIKGLKNIGNISPDNIFSDYDESEAYQEPSTQRTPL